MANTKTVTRNLRALPYAKNQAQRAALVGGARAASVPPAPKRGRKR